MGLISEFRTFVARGNVVDMAVGIAVGAAFGAIAKSLVDDVLMPPIGLLLGNRDMTDLFALLRAGDPPPPYPSLADAQAAGAVTLNWGVFVNTIISFFIIAAAIFLIVRTINRLRSRQEAPPAAPTERTCPYCLFKIPIQATRCAHCTSELKAG